MSESRVLPRSDRRTIEPTFFDRDPRDVASDLIGALLVSSAAGVETGGMVVEAEAYLGSEDPGSHAATKGVTKRNAVMYGPPGTVYVYFTYGNHHMVNLVCCAPGTAGAVLIRALEPVLGVEAMRERRGGRSLHELTNGPGKVAQALGVDLSDNGTLLGEGNLVVYHWDRPPVDEIGVSGRVGLSTGHELELRFFLKGNPFVSRGRTGEPRRRTKRPESGKDRRSL